MVAFILIFFSTSTVYLFFIPLLQLKLRQWEGYNILATIQSCFLDYLNRPQNVLGGGILSNNWYTSIIEQHST